MAIMHIVWQTLPENKTIKSNNFVVIAIRKMHTYTEYLLVQKKVGDNMNVGNNR